MAPPVTLDARLRQGAIVSLIALIGLCVLWESWLAPLRPGGSMLVLKAVPLLLPLRGIVRGNLYTYQWASMLVLLYFMEGIVRATSDPAPSSYYAWLEVVLTTAFFWCTVLYVKPAKRAFKAAKKAAERKPLPPSAEG